MTISTSVITPCCNGCITAIPGGVFPAMACAACPMATTAPLCEEYARMDGSLRMIPSPFRYITVLTVPRSTAISSANNLLYDQDLIIRIDTPLPVCCTDPRRHTIHSFQKTEPKKTHPIRGVSAGSRHLGEWGMARNSSPTTTAETYSSAPPECSSPWRAVFPVLTTSTRMMRNATDPRIAGMM